MGSFNRHNVQDTVKVSRNSGLVDTKAITYIFVKQIQSDLQEEHTTENLDSLTPSGNAGSTKLRIAWKMHNSGIPVHV